VEARRRHVTDHMKVGELARRTGLSVRTLHHYDEIGLLSPARRTPSGHRLYGPADVRRLQHIVSLRHLGLPLNEIRASLERPALSLERVIRLQIVRIGDEMDRQRRLLGLLEELLRRLEASTEISLEELTTTIEGTLQQGRHFTPDQLEYLARRGREIGESRIRASEGEWRSLLDAYGDAMRRGLDPASPEVLKLVSRSDALLDEFTGGDRGIRAALAEMYAREGGDTVLARFGLDVEPGVWEYMGRARAARGDGGHAGAHDGAE
jgi:DNA-binding transcriptional MerR regulator